MQEPMRPTTRPISATHVSYYHLCHRKLWLFHRDIKMEQTSEAVGEGKLIEQQSYTRRATRWRELDLGFLKIDHFDASARVVREVKKSPKLERAHVAQVQYYLRVLERAGIGGVRGVIEYPKQRRRREVELTEEVRREIEGWEAEIERIVGLERCPERVRKGYCNTCAYYDFCFV